MARDWHRVELIRALSTLVSQGAMEFTEVKVRLAVYDERKELQEALDLVLEHEHDDNPVSLDEAYSSVMTGISLSAEPLEDQES